MELSHHCLKVVTGEFPLEWRSHVLIVLLEAEESVFDFLKRVEVVGRERLAFNDGEVDFDLIELGNQAIERLDTGGLLATAEELRAMNIHRGQVRPGAASRVLVLDTSGLAWTGRQGGMLANARLDAGLFVSREIVTARLKRYAALAGLTLDAWIRIASSIFARASRTSSLRPSASSLIESAPDFTLVRHRLMCFTRSRDVRIRCI
jgi:hypothetical protein